MPESRDTAPDGTPRTDRDQAPDSSDPRATPSVPTPSVPTPEAPPPFEPDTPLERLPSEDVPVSPEAAPTSTPSPVATRAPDATAAPDATPADDAAPVTDAVPHAPLADEPQDHTPVPRERKALVGLETTYRSENASKTTTSSTGGFTQRSLPEVERPTSSLRVAEGRFAAIEQKLDQIEARLRLLEKQSEKAGGGALPRWALWVFFLLVIVVVHLLSRRF